MRVLVATLGMHTPWVDGRITSLRTLAETWVEQGVEVQVMTTGPAELAGEVRVQEGGVAYRVFPGGNRRNWWQWVRAFWRCCRRREWDLVVFRPFAGFNTTNIAAIAVFRLICALRRVPFVLSLWGGPAEVLRVRWFFTFTLLIGGRYARSRRVITLPPLVAVASRDDSRGNRRLLRRWDIAEGDFVCLFTYCGKSDSASLWDYIMRRRGLGDLIEAAVHLRTVPGVKIVVSMPLLANEQTRAALSAHLKSKGVEALFVLTPEIDDLDEVLRAVDAYLYPIDLDEVSWAPLSVLEAFACGTPVITTRVPVIQRYIAEGEALFYDPGHPGELAGLMHRLQLEKGVADELRRNANEKLATFSSRGPAAMVSLEALQVITGATSR